MKARERANEASDETNRKRGVKSEFNLEDLDCLNLTKLDRLDNSELFVISPKNRNHSLLVGYVIIE